MDFDKEIAITSKDKIVQLPLKNLLRLTIVYLEPFIDEYLVEVSKQDFVKYKTHKPIIMEMLIELLKKLGVESGKGKVLL